MKFVFHRERTIASVFGHVIHFPKGEPTHVPPEVYREVIAVGGVPEEELDLDKPVPKDGKPEPVDPVAREKALFDAFEVIVLRNKRGEFTAGGQPHLKTLHRELGWDISDKERDLAWVKFQTTTRD